VSSDPAAIVPPGSEKSDNTLTLVSNFYNRLIYFDICESVDYVCAAPISVSALREAIMAARLDSACKFICTQGEWRVTNLQLQNILYMAQMYYMGEHGGERLVETHFEARDDGPVSPSLDDMAKSFGGAPVKDVFFDAREFCPEDSRGILLEAVCADLLKRTLAELVDITNWQHGAWAKNYLAGADPALIPDRDIVKEYQDRVAESGGREASF
jgi:uncharacterized phage-associated protein